MITQKNVMKTVILAAVLGVLIFFNSTKPVETLYNFAARIMKPIAALAGRFSRAVPSAADEENLREMAEKFEVETLRQENARLRQALSLRTTFELPLRGADVISYFQEFGKEFLLIGGGNEAGLREGDVVLDQHGFVVGFVHEVRDAFAKVSIASNAGTTHEAEIIPGSTRVLAKSIGARTFLLELLPADAAVHTGDFVGVVQSVAGVRRIFLLAELRKSTERPGNIFKEAHAVLVARPETLATVFVISSSR